MCERGREREKERERECYQKEVAPAIRSSKVVLNSKNGEKKLNKNKNRNSKFKK